MKETLEYALKNCRAIKFGDFILASGKKSKYYIDIRIAVTKPLLLTRIAHEIITTMKFHDIKGDYIGCVELGCVPIGTIVSVYTGLPLIIVRKEAKNHGTKGRLMGEFEKGKTVILLEDVTTTGGSVLSAANALKDEGLIVEHVITVVDREEGALQYLKDNGLKLISLLRAGELLKRYYEDLGEELKETGVVKEGEFKLISEKIKEQKEAKVAIGAD